MRASFWDKKIPTIFGLIVITLGIAVSTFLTKGGSLSQINAGPGQEPKNVQISNISDASFTVSYTTDDQVIGTLNYGNDPASLTSVALDDRDQLSQAVNKYNVHSITVNNLSPSKTYYFSIASADKQYLNNGSNYSVGTGSVISTSPSDQIPLSGKVIKADGSAPSEGLAYITINGAQKLSTYLKKDGNFTAPLNNLRNSSLNDYFNLDTNVIINIDVSSENTTSSVSVSPDQINPVPVITLSNSYDFSSSPQVSSSGAEQNLEFPAVGNVSKTGEPQILTPDSGQEFVDQQPDFQGTAQPNETVSVVIHSSENIQTKVTTDSSGRWTFRPTTPLSPGEHTITITTKNSQGILRTITQKFVVFAAGSQVDESATPSATLTPTASPTLAPTKIPSPGVTITPAPTIEQVATASPIPTLPPTGSSSVIMAAVAGIAAVASGIILFILKRGQSSL